MKLTKTCKLLLLGTIASHPVALFAQAAPAADSRDAAGDGGGIEDIIVTARRVNESQQKVPIAIQSIDGEQLSRQGITNAAEIQKVAPGVRVKGGSSFGDLEPSYIIRGLQNIDGAPPSSVTYVNDVPVDAVFVGYTIFDIANIQVLKGPQGTLFGTNSVGGAVLINSKRPVDQFEGYLDARYGRFNDVQLTGVINAPIAKGINLRVSANGEWRNGYVKSLTSDLAYNNRNHFTIRGGLQIDPTENLSNYVEYIHYGVHERGNPGNLENIDLTCSAGLPLCVYLNPALNLDPKGRILDPARAGIDRTFSNSSQRSQVNYDAITNITSLETSFATIKNIAYRSWGKFSSDIDYDDTDLTIVNLVNGPLRRESFSDEVQVVGDLFDGRLKWIAGGFHSWKKNNDLYYAYIFQEFSDAVFPPPGISPIGPQYLKQVDKSNAVFGQITAAITPKLNLTVGGRYTKDKKRLLRAVYLTNVCSLAAVPPPLPPEYNLATCTSDISTSDSAFTYNLSADWKPFDELLLYATHRKGYKAGAPNPYSSNISFGSFGKEVAKDYEVGFKSDFKLGSVPIRFNADIFYIDFVGVQTSFSVLNPYTSSFENIIFNGVPGKPNTAKIHGFELEAVAKPFADLTLNGSYSHTRGHYSKFSQLAPVGSAVLNLDGAPVPLQPSSFTLGLEYKPGWFPASLAQPVLSADLYHSGGFRADPFIGAIRIAPYTTLDAQLQFLDIAGSTFTFSIYGKNITDKRYVQRNRDFTPTLGFTSVFYGEPATYGVALRYSF
jgi:iron complex outermembrane receptor protein